MARSRVSRLQKYILRLLMVEHHRTHGGTSMGHLELVKALAGDKSNISHSLRTLERLCLKSRFCTSFICFYYV
jgi:hypothetical protein